MLRGCHKWQYESWSQLWDHWGTQVQKRHTSVNLATLRRRSCLHLLYTIAEGLLADQFRSRDSGWMVTQLKFR